MLTIKDYSGSILVVVVVVVQVKVRVRVTAEVLKSESTFQPFTCNV